MLNIGLIGKFESLEKLIEKLIEYQDIKIEGKSSVGIKNQPSDYRYSTPEYNRVELIERSEAIFLEDISLVPFSLIKDTIKRNKHIFLSEFPKFSDEQFHDLIKLIDEAKTVVQIKNPLFFHSQFQFIKKNSSAPYFFKIKLFVDSQEELFSWLSELIILSIILFQKAPRRIRPISIGNPGDSYFFQNYRFEFSDSSVLDIDFTNPVKGVKPQAQIYHRNGFYSFELQSEELLENNRAVRWKKSDIQLEYSTFFTAISKKQPPITGLREYHEAVKVLRDVQSKLNIVPS